MNRSPAIEEQACIRKKDPGEAFCEEADNTRVMGIPDPLRARTQRGVTQQRPLPGPHGMAPYPLRCKGKDILQEQDNFTLRTLLA